MTLQQLQEFLDDKKWKDSEAHACDMCGRYARCRYCVRTEEYPCAMAHDRFVAATSAPVPDRVPDWLLPEPDIPEPGTPAAEEPAAQETAAAPSQPALQPASQPVPVPQPAAQPASQSAAEAQADGQRPRPHVIVRGKKGEVRLCALQRRIPTVSSELGG